MVRAMKWPFAAPAAPETVIDGDDPPPENVTVVVTPCLVVKLVTPGPPEVTMGSGSPPPL